MCNDELSKDDLENGTRLAPRCDVNGLVTAVVQDADKLDILMLAHMNQDAVDKTIETGEGWFWSRSRQKLWMKGETSGNTLDVQEILIDCDQDALILKVQLNGAGACHSGERTCFYRAVDTSSGAVQLIRQ